MSIRGTHASIIHIIVACLMHRCHLVILCGCCNATQYVLPHTTIYYFHSSLLVLFLYSSFCLLYDAITRFISRRVSSSSSSLLSLLSINNFPLLLSQPQISIRPLLSAARAMFFLPLADDGGGRKDSEDGSDVLGADTSRGRPQTRQSATTPPLQCIGGVVADCGVYYC